MKLHTLQEWANFLGLRVSSKNEYILQVWGDDEVQLQESNGRYSIPASISDDTLVLEIQHEDETGLFEPKLVIGEKPETVEVVKKVVKEVPVEVIKEVVKEVPVAAPVTVDLSEVLSAIDAINDKIDEMNKPADVAPVEGTEHAKEDQIIDGIEFIKKEVNDAYNLLRQDVLSTKQDLTVSEFVGTFNALKTITGNAPAEKPVEKPAEQQA